MSTLIVAAGLAVHGLAQTAPTAAEEYLRAQTHFDFEVHAPYSVTAPLFGPEGERVWAGEDWEPHFIYPLPAKDIEGAVFSVRHGEVNATWVNTLFDVEGKHFQYVYFLPKIMVTVIDVRFTLMSANITGVHVDYTRTAITLEGNEDVKTMSVHDQAAVKEWALAIDDYLAHSKDSMQH